MNVKKYHDAAEAVKNIFRIFMKAEEEIGAVIDEFKAQHEDVTPERLCWFASQDPYFTEQNVCLSDVNPGFSFTVPMVLRMVYNHFYPGGEHAGVFKSFEYFKKKGVE